VRWKVLSGQARSASIHHPQQRTSCSNLRGGWWRSVKGEPRSGVREAPSCRDSKCQFPRGTSRRLDERGRGRQQWLSGSPRPQPLAHPKEWSGGKLSATSSCLRKTPSADGAQVAEMCRSARMTGARVLGAAQGQARCPDGERPPHRPSLPVLPSRALTFDSASPAALPGCLVQRPRRPLGPAWTEGQA
jgi:hypothetical protein